MSSGLLIFFESEFRGLEAAAPERGLRLKMGAEAAEFEGPDAGGVELRPIKVRERKKQVKENGATGWHVLCCVLKMNEVGTNK